MNINFVNFAPFRQPYPEAKVILTVRDSEDAWVKSWKEHLQINSRMIPFYVKLLFYIYLAGRNENIF